MSESLFRPDGFDIQHVTVENPKEEKVFDPHNYMGDKNWENLRQELKTHIERKYPRAYVCLSATQQMFPEKAGELQLDQAEQAHLVETVEWASKRYLADSTGTTRGFFDVVAASRTIIPGVIDYPALYATVQEKAIAHTKQFPNTINLAELRIAFPHQTDLQIEDYWAALKPYYDRTLQHGRTHIEMRDFCLAFPNHIDELVVHPSFLDSLEKLIDQTEDPFSRAFFLYSASVLNAEKIEIDETGVHLTLPQPKRSSDETPLPEQRKY